MRAGLTLMMVAPLAACVAAQPAADTTAHADVAAMMEPAEGGGVQLRRTEAPAYTMSDGAQARRDADALCGGRVTSTIYDRFDAGVWVFVGGCTG